MREAECRHCGLRITQQASTDYWVDQEGFTACGKSPTMSAAHAIYHQPFPPGFRGEPRDLAPA